MMFEIGERVVCVDDNFDVGSYPRRYDSAYRRIIYPQLGSVYTIRWIDNDRTNLQLEEIINEHMPFLDHGVNVVCEYDFDIWRFRKLPKTSIKIFTEMAANTDLKIKVDA